MLETNFTKTELTKIIHALMNFIVVDAKNHLDQKQKEEYIKRYIYLLAKSMNGKPDVIDVQKMKNIIDLDIQKHYS